MTGEIYSIPISGRHNTLPHPHMVVVAVGENCLCVPAFTVGGPELQLTLAAFQRSGVYAHECCVELDNARHVTFATSMTGHRAAWLIGKRQILSKSVVSRQTLIGTMDARGMLEIVDCVLRWHQAKPDNLPPNQVKAVQKLRRELRALLYPTPPPP